MSYNQTYTCACVFSVFVLGADSYAGHHVLFHSSQRWDDHRDFDGLVEKVHQTIDQSWYRQDVYQCISIGLV